MLAVTDGDITMPNMKGWTTDDVLAFQELTGINVTTKGSGYVTKQSVASGSTLKSNNKIEIELSTDDPNDSTSLTDSRMIQITLQIIQLIQRLMIKTIHKNK